MRVVKTVDEIASAMYSLHRSSEKAVVIACADSISSYLDSNRNKLIKDFILPGSEEEGKITRLMNKNSMMQLAIDCGIAVPQSWIVYPAKPEISSVVFRFIPKRNRDSEEYVNELNKKIRRKLIHDKGIVIGQTVYDHKVFLKFTLLNPRMTHEKLDSLLELISTIGSE